MHALAILQKCSNHFGQKGLPQKIKNRESPFKKRVCFLDRFVRVEPHSATSRPPRGSLIHFGKTRAFDAEVNGKISRQATQTAQQCQPHHQTITSNSSNTWFPEFIANMRPKHIINNHKSSQQKPDQHQPKRRPPRRMKEVHIVRFAMRWCRIIFQIEPGTAVS